MLDVGLMLPRLVVETGCRVPFLELSQILVEMVVLAVVPAVLEMGREWRLERAGLGVIS